jgi:nicotinamide-nucleotide amidase
MRAETMAVGTEILLGDIVDTNAAHIGRELARAGVDHTHHVVLGDNEERIAEAIVVALGRADALIVTGGLGPTQDDVTREAIARATGRPLRRDPAIEAWLRDRWAKFGRPMAENNLRQADVPEGARVIEQTFGTAPGLIVEHGDRVIYAIPGVPAEMRDMLARGVLPDVQRREGGMPPIVSRIVRVAGVSESSIAESLGDLWSVLGENVTMAFLAGGGEVRIRLTAKAPDDTRASELLGAAEAGVRAALGPAVVGTDDETLEKSVGALLLARGWTMGAAESLTGGALGARASSVPGASEWFRGSIVSYATGVKTDVLGVPQAVVDEHGPVSEPVARAMAAGARRTLGSDVAVALTGVAGPTEQGRPVGTVVVAVDGPLGCVVREVRLPGDRETVRTLSAAAGLNLVRLYLLEVTQ